MFSILSKTKIIIYVLLFCRLQMLSIWTSLEFCLLVQSSIKQLRQIFLCNATKVLIKKHRLLQALLSQMIIITRGPWWSWIAHLSHFPHNWILHLCSFGSTCDPQGGASFDSKGIIWIRLIKVHKELLNIKYQRSNPFSFREKFWSWFSLFLCSNLWTPGRGQFSPH